MLTCAEALSEDCDSAGVGFAGSTVADAPASQSFSPMCLTRGQQHYAIDAAVLGSIVATLQSQKDAQVNAVSLSAFDTISTSDIYACKTCKFLADMHEKYEATFVQDMYPSAVEDQHKKLGMQCNMFALVSNIRLQHAPAHCPDS